MMATTHALAGVALAAAAGAVAPELGLLPVAVAALGGAFPDLDMYAGHRRTLHFPVYYAVAAVPAAVVALVAPGPAAAAVALFLAAAALHSASDALGGGLELRPWEATSDRAVYSHYHGRWLPPRRVVRYDGAPEDLALAAVLAVPAVVVFGPTGPVATGVAAALATSAVYVAIRKPMVVAAERLVSALPEGVRARLPARFVEDLV
jgi:hypothetical protein